MTLLESLLRQAAHEGVITCPVCGSSLEPDAEECGECQWENPLIKLGYI